MTTFTRGIEAETEKAYKISIAVTWGGNLHIKSFWLPKSVVKITENDNHGNPIIEVADFFAKKMEYQNAFKGYYMYFAQEIK